MKLRKQIQNYTPFDQQESKDQSVILKWIDSFPDVLTRKNEFAHLTSSAFVVNSDRNKVLMVYHNIYNSWIFIGGHADGEANLLDVAPREIQEETGVKSAKPVTDDILSLDTFPILGHFKRGNYVPAHVHLSVTYLFQAGENEPLIIKEDENSGVQWIPIDKIIEKSTEPYMIPLYKKAIAKTKNI